MFQTLERDFSLGLLFPFRYGLDDLCPWCIGRLSPQRTLSLKKINFERDIVDIPSLEYPSILEKYEYNNLRLRDYEKLICEEDVIDGWVSPHDLRFLDFINSIPMNNEGGVCEIGVHCGKYFTPLNQLTDEKSLAVDLFLDQERNVSLSGGLRTSNKLSHLSGYRKKWFTDLRFRFNHTLEKYDDKHKGENVELLEADSMTLVPQDLGIRRFKFISVDGGHNVEHVQSDLKLVERCIKPEGVVILDDWFNFRFQSVTEGYYRYKSQGGSLVPFAHVHNKLYLCNYSVHHMYIKYLENLNVKKISSEISGYEVVVVDTYEETNK